ncbi:MAG: 23S rRNA (adenine(2503)-C(2))-methyltransferase RlmN [Phycisphaerales bacterium]
MEIAGVSILDPMSLTHSAFAQRAAAWGVPRERALGVYAGFYRDGVGAQGDGAHRSETGATREDAGSLPFALPAPPVPVKVHASESAEGEVRKFLLRVPRHAENINRRAPGAPGDARLPDDLETESVIIPMAHRGGRSFTLCVSSQVGCAMGCEFCETAQMGLIRSLQPREIVAQWHAARHALGAEIKNIVFMGMGEPLDNAEAVLEAIAILTDHRGPAIAMKNITISTVGRLDGLALLGERIRQDGWKRLNLAVSINAPNDAIRSRIMPINRGMPLGELIPMLVDWPMRSSSAICCEYVLIPGVNDAPEHADELAALLRPVRCCVNVIPYNPRRDSPWPAPTEEATWSFLRRLESHGQFCKYRRTKGRETMAACGQLGNERIRGRKLVGLTIDAG